MDSACFNETPPSPQGELKGASWALPSRPIQNSTTYTITPTPTEMGKKKPEPEPEPTVSSFIFLGTGTSSQVPAIGCLTSPTSRCLVCPSALHPSTQKNRRRNTSALLTLSNQKTILIDCGKSFFDTALQIWPRARLRQIDALLLTHAHADAMLGLDDLRGWTLGGFIQKSIDIYCSRKTFEAVQEMFPYMVDTAKATGGGDVPAFKWNIIHPLHNEFYIPGCGISVTTLPVEHGNYFDAKRSPFWCLGFKIGGVCYISDASSIPAKTEKKIQGCEMLVLDALKWGHHPSHIGIEEALEIVNRLEDPPRKTFLVDFTHEVDHYSFEKELRTEQKLDIVPAYDGQQVFFEDGVVVREMDLLAEKEWISVAEAKKNLPKGKPNGHENGHVKTMV